MRLNELIGLTYYNSLTNKNMTGLNDCYYAYHNKFVKGEVVFYCVYLCLIVLLRNPCEIVCVFLASALSKY